MLLPQAINVIGLRNLDLRQKSFSAYHLFRESLSLLFAAFFFFSATLLLSDSLTLGLFFSKLSLEFFLSFTLFLSDAYIINS